MDEYVQDRLEQILDDSLPEAEKAQVQAVLDKDSNTARELKELEETAELFVGAREATRESASFELDPAFFARVMQSVEAERRVPFWVAFLEPLFVKRLAFGALVWMAMLGSYVAMYDDPDFGRGQRMANIFVSCEPTDYHVHFGNNVNDNRNSMMVVLAAHSD